MTLRVDLPSGLCRLFSLFLVASEIAAGAAAVAQQPADWDSCSGRSNPTAEQRIDACTAIVEAAGQTPADRAKALGFRGVVYANKGDIAAAARDYDEALSLDATSSSGHRIRGNKYLLERNSDGALAEYDEAVRLDPTSAFALVNRGLIYVTKKEYDRAIADYDEAIRLDPAWTLAYYGRGRVFAATKDYDRAIADFDQAVRLNPKFVAVFVARGAARQAKGDLPQAIADYDQAIALDPKSANALYDRGTARNAMKDYDGAMADLNAAIALNPKYAGAYIARGIAYGGKVDYDRAIADFNQALSLDANSASAFYNRGNAYLARRDYDRAVADYDNAVRVDPKFALAVVARGELHSRKQEYVQAIADYDAAMQIDPGLAIAYGRRCGDRIAARQDLQTALSDCNESLRLQPRQAVAPMHRGFISLKLGDPAKAIADFDAAYSFDPKDVVALYGRGLAKWKKGDTFAAELDLTAAKKSRPDIIRVVAGYYDVMPERNLLSRLAILDTQDHPMTFAIAHGEADACGPGCSEWIVADGDFDRGAAQRFRDLLNMLGRRKPPLFFNSNGGLLTVSFAVGRALREREMTAGVAITVADDCHANPLDESCRKLLRTSQPLQARLQAPGAVCYSACVYALIGASVRQVAQGAQVGVHEAIRPQPDARSGRTDAAVDAQSYASTRQYVKQMGVDPDLVDFSAKTPNINIHVLTRDEMARFQIETPSRSGRSDDAAQAVTQKAKAENEQDPGAGF